jgi:methyl-accepting chemotaxis protein
MNEITTASDEQRDGIEQVNQAITQMDAVTQQNAALVEEAAAAAASMQEQSARLSEVVGVFKLNQVAAAPVSRIAARQASFAKATKEAPPVLRHVVRAAAQPAPAARKAMAATADAKDEWEEF